MKFRVRLIETSTRSVTVRDIEADDVEESLAVMGDIIGDGDNIEVYLDSGMVTDRAMLTRDPFELIGIGEVEDGLLNWRTRPDSTTWSWTEQEPIGSIFL